MLELKIILRELERLNTKSLDKGLDAHDVRTLESLVRSRKLVEDISKDNEGKEAEAKVLNLSEDELFNKLRKGEGNEKGKKGS